MRDRSGWVTSASSSGAFGGDITLMGSSDMSDSVLEVCHVGPPSLSRVPPVLARVVAGHTKAHPATEMEGARVVSFVAPVGMITMADGDRTVSTPFAVDATPGVVSILM